MNHSPAIATGRPRLFDEETVLTTLTALFWRQGYGQTSMLDIVNASGVHKPSLYRTFGSKDQLFAKVLERYLSERMAMFASLIEQAGPGLDGVHRFLKFFEDDAISERGRDGCLMVMASNELRGSLHGYDFSASYRQQMRHEIGVLIQGAAPAAASNPELTRARTDLVSTYLLGMQVIMRSGASPSEIQEYLSALHVAVDLW